MATWTLHASISVLMTIAMTVQSTNHFAPQVVYQRLEHALITNSEVRWLMQHKFPNKIFFYVNVTIESMLLASCDERSPVLTGTTMNFSYYQEFSGAVLPYSTSFQLISY